MDLSWQQSDNPKPLSLPPQEAARCDNLVNSKLLLSGDKREIKFDLEQRNLYNMVHKLKEAEGEFVATFRLKSTQMNRT